MNINLKKKIVAAVTTMSLAAWMIPGSAFALTADELQTQINALMAQLATLQAQLTQIQTPAGGAISCTITSFAANLKQGDSSEAVKCLQVVLNSSADTKVAASGVGSSGNETMFFGALTKAGVVKFQEKYAADVLTPLGLTAGTGFVGSGTRAKLNTMLGTGGVVTPTPVTPTPTVGVGAATIALAVDTPEAAQVAKNAQDVLFTKVKFYGGAAGATITKVMVTRGGVSADADVSAVKLYDGATQLGSTQALNTNTHKATFTGLSWNIPAGETKHLTIKGNIAASPTVGDSVKLNLAEAADITSSAAIEGTFPISGNAKTIAGISVGELFVATTTAPSAATILSGSTEQQIAGWTFEATSSEGMKVHSIKVTHAGSATRDDVKNVKLTIDGVQIGSTVATLDTYNAATFDLSSAPLSILASQSKTVYAYADIVSGIWTSRTVIFEITQYTDVTAYGANSGGSVQISQDDTHAFLRATGNTMTIGQGDVTVAVDASLNPAAQTYVKGTSNRLISAFKFSSGSREGIRVSELKLKLTGAVTDISNITLWDGTTQVGGSASAIGSYVTFGANTIGWDTTGIFDVAKSSNKTIQVKADIPSGAATGATIELYINAAADVKVDGLDSQYDLASSAVTVTSAGSANTNSHTIGATGTLTIAKSSLTPAAQTYVKGSTAKEFLKINLTAGSGEDVSVTAITLRCDIGSGTTACGSTGTTTNMKLLKSDGVQYGSTVSSPSGSAAFSGSLTVPASQTVTLTLVGDIPSTAGAGTHHWDHDGAADQTSTGVSSSADLTESGDAAGNVMTIGTGAVTVAAAATPGDQVLIIGATEASLVGLVLTAGTAENIRVTYFKLWTSSSVEASSTDLGNIALYDGATRLTAKKNLTTGSTAADESRHHYLEFSASDFLNSSGIDLVKGQQKTVTVKGDLISTGTGDHKIAIGVSTTDDISTVGLLSNADVTETYTTGPSSASGVNYHYAKTAANIYEVTLASAGTLTVSNNANLPSTAIHATGQDGAGAGLAGVAFHKVDFLSAREDINIKSISVERASGGADADFSALTLWDGATQLGTAQTFVNGSTTFSFIAGSYWRLPKGVTKTLTIKADLNGVRTVDGYGASTGDAPIIAVDTIDPQGVSSGNDNIAVNSGTAADTTTLDLTANVQYIRQSKSTLASASLPSTVLGSGEKALYRWTVTADSKGDIGWNKVVFDMSGNVTVSSAGNTVGCGASNCTPTHSVMMSTGTDISTSALIATTSMKVYNLTTGEQITATSTSGTGWTVTNASGIAKVSFVPASEQTVAAGQTTTYEFRGNILQAGASGDNLQTKLTDRGTTATTTAYGGVNMVNNHTSLFTWIWTDRSGAAGTHSAGSVDWTHDYKVPGIPTATLSLSR